MGENTLGFKGKYEGEISDLKEKTGIKNVGDPENCTETEETVNVYIDSSVNFVASDWFVDDVEEISNKHDIHTKYKDTLAISDTSNEIGLNENQTTKKFDSRKAILSLIIGIVIVCAVAFGFYKLSEPSAQTDYYSDRSDVLDNDELEDTNFTDEIVTVERIGNEEYHYLDNGQIEYVLSYDDLNGDLGRVYFYISNELVCFYDIQVNNDASKFRYCYYEEADSKYACWFYNAPFEDYNLSELQENPYQFLPEWYTLTDEDYYDDLGNLLYGFTHNFVKQDNGYIDYVEQYDENVEFVGSWEDIYDNDGNLISTTND